MNSLNVISPYVFNTQWVFDDPQKELIQEPFVSGADNIIDMMTMDIPNAEKGFVLIFSDQSFPGHHAVLIRAEKEQGGTWYYDRDTGIRGWLCPALFKYFDKAPRRIYVQVRAK